MRTKIFHWDEDGNGWKPDGIPEFDAGNATTVAHDVLEHVNDESGFKWELLAFGAILYGRAFRDSRSYVTTFVHDLSGFLRNENFVVPESRAVAPLPVQSEKVLVEMRKGLLQKYERENDDFLSFLMGKPEVNLRIAAAAIDRCLPWIRRGYRLAKRMHRDHTRGDFKAYVDGLVQAVLDDHEANPPVTGDTLTIHADRKALTFELVRGHE